MKEVNTIEPVFNFDPTGYPETVSPAGGAYNFYYSYTRAKQPKEPTVAYVTIPNEELYETWTNGPTIKRHRKRLFWTQMAVAVSTPPRVRLLLSKSTGR